MKYYLFGNPFKYLQIAAILCYHWSREDGGGSIFRYTFRCGQWALFSVSGHFSLCGSVVWFSYYFLRVSTGCFRWFCVKISPLIHQQRRRVEESDVHSTSCVQFCANLLKFYIPFLNVNKLWLFYVRCVVSTCRPVKVNLAIIIIADNSVIIILLRCCEVKCCEMWCVRITEVNSPWKEGESCFFFTTLQKVDNDCLTMY